MKSRSVSAAALLLLLALVAATPPAASAQVRAPRRRRLLSPSQISAAREDAERSTRLISSCSERWHNTSLDHYAFRTAQKFPLRYYYCDEHYVPGGPIFFYVGNEADVTTFLNATGLMWEHAEHFNALLIFAEHRYFGESQPFPDEPIDVYQEDPAKLSQQFAYLTVDQAIGDFVGLIYQLRKDLGDRHAPVIGFGGSYGAMLGTWMRIKFPHMITGMIAGSAVIGGFDDLDPPYDPGSFDEVVTEDAGPYGGASVDCVPNVNASWPVIAKLGETDDGRKQLESIFNLCPDETGKLNSTDDVSSFEELIQGAFENMAMGNWGISTNYFTGNGYLPAWPLRVACDLMGNSSARDNGTELLTNLAKVTNLYYNATGEEKCLAWNTPTSSDDLRWSFLSCSSNYFNESTPPGTMFPPFSNANGLTSCNETWGFFPSPAYPYIHYGGIDIASGPSNIVFSNGLLDPWHPGGVLEDLSDTLVAIVIPGEAHHADLAFSSPNDSEALREARALEVDWIHRWIDEARELHPSPFGAPAVEATPPLVE